MADEPTSFSAERRWLTHSAQFRDLVLDNVWCRSCRDAVRILSYSVQPKPGGISLEGVCAICGNRVARYIENPEPPPAGI
jgi:hypothetical protein